MPDCLADIPLGGPDGELSASMRYLAQRYTMPYRECMATLTDIGTEELAHLEMICAIVYQLTKNMTMEELKASGFDKYYVDHTTALWPQAAGGIPFNACEFQSKGDVITDLTEDLAAEQKARTTYDNLLRLVKDPEVADPLRFLRAREVVHFQRFGEAKREVSSKYPGSGKPTPAPFCNRKTKIQKMYELKPDLGVLLPTSNAPFSFHK